MYKISYNLACPHLVGLESSGWAALSAGAGHQGSGGDVGTAEEVRRQVQRAVVLTEEVQRQVQRAGGGQDGSSGRAT